VINVPGMIELKPGATIRCGDHHYLITHLLDLESILVREEKSGRIERLYLKDLAAARLDDPSDSIQACDLPSVNEADWQIAEERFAIIRPLLGEVWRTRESVAIQARAAKVHTATVYHWLKLYEQTGRVSALLPTRPDGGRGKSRLSQEVEAIINDTLENYYLKQQKPSAQKTCLEVIRLCRQVKLKPPHPNTVRQRIAALSEELKMKRRRGAKAAREKFEPAAGAFPGADWPLAYVQIDHTMLDIILVDDLHRLPVGRPWITLAVDVFSRMVTGFYISFDPPGSMSVGLCLTHSILPKEKWLAKYNISTPWSCWGLMGTLHADNAGEFRGQMLKRACAEYGINLEWRPVAQPSYGAHIERLLGTVLKEIHSLPGTTFSEPKEKGEYNSEKEAAMTLSELEEWLAVFITQVYHQRIHNELRTSPIKRYEEGLIGTKDRPGTGLPDRVSDEDRLRLDFMPYLKRTIQPRGVVVDEIHYFSDVLRRFINAADPDNPRYKRKFIFKRDPRDISVLYFYDPDVKRYYSIPYRDTSRPALSIWELRETTRRLKEEGRRDIDENLIFAAYARMRAAEEQSVRETKRARRGGQRRLHHQHAVKPQLPDQPLPSDQDEEQAAEATAPIMPFEEMEELG
jgi:putative transposase